MLDPAVLQISIDQCWLELSRELTLKGIMLYMGSGTVATLPYYKLYQPTLVHWRIGVELSSEAHEVPLGDADYDLTIDRRL